MTYISRIRSLARQENFPRLWGVFQTLFGATKDKAALASERLQPGDIVIEIGCSTGLLARHLSGFPFSKYIGVDTDAGALIQARDLCLDERFSFVTKIPDGTDFDPGNRVLILLSHVLHHLDEEEFSSLLVDLSSLFPGAAVFILDPEKDRDSYSLRYRFFYKLENGRYRRDLHRVTDLLKEHGWSVIAWAEHRAHPPILGGRHAGTMWSIDAQIPSDEDSNGNDE